MRDNKVVGVGWGQGVVKISAFPKIVTPLRKGSCGSSVN